MEWLFKPKVQLGLFVNFVFVMFTLVSSSAGERIASVHRRASAVETSAATSAETFRYVPLPPRLGPSQAVSNHDKQSGQINVYTTHELTLVKKDGRTLTLSPSFYVHGDTIVPPRKVFLAFFSSAPAQFYADECALEIKAEGVDFLAALPVSHDRASKGGAQGVVEGMGQEIPYPVFVKLVTSDRVTIKVGAEEITLTEAQLGALRDMQRCIQDGTCG